MDQKLPKSQPDEAEAYLKKLEEMERSNADNLGKGCETGACWRTVVRRLNR